MCQPFKMVWKCINLLAVPLYITCVIAVSVITVTAQTSNNASFRFANIYGDNMVLQQAPHQANLWGFVPTCDTPVTVEFNEKTYPATLIQNGNATCKWHVTLPATPASSQKPYSITATTQKYGKISITNVLFGDVWICSGQSNMQFTVPQVYNASVEIEEASKYPLIRLFTASLMSSATPVDELLGVEQKWSVAGSDTVNGSAWSYFSATCWFFGRDLFDSLKYPIGLIDTDWGGTPVEAWSSPDALAKCKQGEDVSFKQSQQKRPVHATRTASGPNPHTPSVLWNAMIYPFLNMTIKGAIWYQGESNANNAYTYNCTFPAMIDDWRAKWHTYSMQQTDPLMGFGFVQLAPTGDDRTTVGGFPVIRWAQTANYGYVPNDRLKNVFMAVAIDLGDPKSPYGSIHPRDKQDVGTRLSLSARAVVYGENIIDFQGPIPKSASASPPVDATVTLYVTFQHHGALELRSSAPEFAFEMGCNSGSEHQWIQSQSASVAETDHDVLLIKFGACSTGVKPTMLRYLWRTDPCDFKACPLYDHDSQLPAAPFMIEVSPA